MQSNVKKVDRAIEGEVINTVAPAVTAGATVVRTTDFIQVMATIQIVVPTERELFCIIIEKIQQLDKSIVGTQDDVTELTSSLLNIQDKLTSSKIANKKLISVKEFEEVYTIGEETQRQLRGRRKDSLPFVQLTPRGNVLYDVKIIDKWMENFEKRRK